MSNTELEEVLLLVRGIQSVTDEMIEHLEFIINDKSYGVEPNIKQSDINHLWLLLDDFNDGCVSKHYFRIYNKVMEIQRKPPELIRFVNPQN